MTREQMLRELVAKWSSLEKYNSSYMQGWWDARHKCADELEAILNSGVDGWVLVPREPTETMVDAGEAIKVVFEGGREYVERSVGWSVAMNAWEAMLNAAPTYPTEDKP